MCHLIACKISVCLSFLKRIKMKRFYRISVFTSLLVDASLFTELLYTVGDIGKERHIWSDCATMCFRRPVMKQGTSRKHAYIILTPISPLLYSKTGADRGYTLFFLFLLKNVDCGYSLEPPWQGGSNEYPQSMFWAGIWKIEIFIWFFFFFFFSFFWW